MLLEYNDQINCSSLLRHTLHYEDNADNQVSLSIQIIDGLQRLYTSIFH